MNYYNTEDKTSRIGGLIATCLYILSLVLIFWLLDFSVEQQELQQGIIVDFGDSQMGAGEEDMDAASTPLPSSPSTPSPSQAEYLTDENSLSEVESQEVEQPSEQLVESRDIQEEVTLEEPAREVNKRALFPGTTLSSDSSSQGATEHSDGNQGDESGERDSTPSDGGYGVEGVSWSLSGRNIIGKLPLPSYQDNATGRVVIEIMVDESGRVTRATYRAQGSTTNSSQLVSAARNAALAAQFSHSSEFAQMGEITYNFRLK